LVSHKQSISWWNSQVARNVSLLVLEIYSRAPVVPRSLFLNKIHLGRQDNGDVHYQGKVALRLANYGINVSKSVT
jgi:hypothetical protein